MKSSNGIAEGDVFASTDGRGGVFDMLETLEFVGCNSGSAVNENAKSPGKMKKDTPGRAFTFGVTGFFPFEAAGGPLRVVAAGFLGAGGGTRCLVTRVALGEATLATRGDIPFLIPAFLGVPPDESFRCVLGVPEDDDLRAC